MDTKLPVRLNITMDAALYRRLKRDLPNKRISAFIEQAVRGRLAPDKGALDAAYRAASKERWRAEIDADWAATDGESWPE